MTQVCAVCGTSFAGLPHKHEKSRAHKDAKRAAVLHSERKESIQSVRTRKQAPSKTSRPCRHCLEVHPSAACHPPEFIRRPRASSSRAGPFVTTDLWVAWTQGLSLRSPTDVLAWGCRPGNWRRLPNIDVRGDNVCIESWAQARAVLDEELSSARKGDPEAGAWVSFDAEGDLLHPPWFQGDGNVRMVPTYSNVIVTIGSTSSIGLHQDTDNRNAQACGRPVQICTYLRVVRGSKVVVLVPPGAESVESFRNTWVGSKPRLHCRCEVVAGEQDVFNGYASDAECDEMLRDHESDEDPELPELFELRRRLVNEGGYMFRLRESQTLVIPHGYWHWLVADAGFSVTLSGSCY